MAYFIDNIRQLALDNDYYRKVVFSTCNTQVVLMSLRPGEEIGMEKHTYTTQVLFIVQGQGVAEIDDDRFSISVDDEIVVPPNIYHNFINTGDIALKLISYYSPPEHEPDVEQKFKPLNEHH